MRAVFDTKMVLSTLLFGRHLAWLRLAWAEGTVTPIVCRETVTELLRVLAYPKFRLDGAEREALLAEYLPFAETVRLPDAPPDLPFSCRDRDDLVFLRLALTSRAELLVSGDKDLTMLASVWSVVSPAGLRQRLAPDG